jgi:ribosomal protein S18 acetylase RimI-like enzyme
VEVEIETGGQWPDEVERLLHGLPEWFGIEAAVDGYVEAARTRPTVVARRDGEVVGICLVRRHNPSAAEIELLAVDRALHRLGIGRRLVDRVSDDLARAGVELLQVKTFGPSGSSVEYERTRAFYDAIGFIPLEERTDIWGPDNPCLISVLPLRGVRAGASHRTHAIGEPASHDHRAE